MLTTCTAAGTIISSAPCHSASDKIPAYSFLCELYMLSVSHDTSQLVSIQSDHVMTRVCIYAPSPRRPWNSRSRSVPFSHRCSCFPLAPTQRLCPWRATDFSRVILVFPFTGRKWNNNRGQGEKKSRGDPQTGALSEQKIRIQYEICECFGCFNEIHISVVCVEGGTSTPHWTLAFLFFYVHWTKRMVSRFCKTLFTRYCRRFFRSLQIWGNYGEIHMGSFPVSDPSRKQVQCPKYQFSGFVL